MTARGDTPSSDLADLRDRLSVAVRRAVPSWLADESEDLVRRSMSRVLATCPDGGVDARQLYVAAHAVVVDEIRRRRHAPPAPSEGLARGDRLGEGVARGLAALSADRRRVVTLHLLGHDVAQIASLLGIDAELAETLATEGLRELRAALP